MPVHVPMGTAVEQQITGRQLSGYVEQWCLLIVAVPLLPSWSLSPIRIDGITHFASWYQASEFLAEAFECVGCSLR